MENRLVDNANNIAGVINIYKEKGYTSHDVVNIVRKSLGRIKTGHTGTLDPDAEGVLPVCVGKATKIADYIQADTKMYRTVIRLGVTTATEDISGDVLKTSPITSEDDDVLNCILAFKGEYYQKPPMYSAIKVNGKKLYELAREGKEVERKNRLIHIYDITDIKKLESDSWQFDVLCSKGTYIRTLCGDIGKKLGCGACMADLTRLASGGFNIRDSIKIDDFKRLAAQGRAESVIIPLTDVLSDYKRVTVDESANRYLYNGNKIYRSFVREDITEGERVLANDSTGKTVGIYIVENDALKPVTMLI